MTNSYGSKDYWDALDREAEEFARKFEDDNEYISRDEHEFIVGKMINDFDRWPRSNADERYRVHNQYKDIAEGLEKRQEATSLVLKKFMNQCDTDLTVMQLIPGLLNDMLPHMQHKEDCLYIQKASSGRRIEINEETDCSCNFLKLKNQVESLKSAIKQTEESHETNDKLRRELLYVDQRFRNP